MMMAEVDGKDTETVINTLVRHAWQLPVKSHFLGALFLETMKINGGPIVQHGYVISTS